MSALHHYLRRPLGCSGSSLAASPARTQHTATCRSSSRTCRFQGWSTYMYEPEQRLSCSAQTLSVNISVKAFIHQETFNTTNYLQDRIGHERYFDCILPVSPKSFLFTERNSTRKSSSLNQFIEKVTLESLRKKLIIERTSFWVLRSVDTHRFQQREKVT